MNIVDGIQSDDIGGMVTVEIIRDGKTGPEVIERRETHNLIVNSGKRQTWRMTLALNTNAWDQFRLGHNSVAANSGQTNVITAVTGTINTADAKSLLAGTRTARLIVSYASGGASLSASNIKEVVVLNQNTSPGGSALMRAVFTAVNKTTADKLRITYQFRIT